MPALIAFGVINQNTPQQNAGLFVGEGNVGGWDANMKMSLAEGGCFGFFNVFPVNANLNFDNFEFIDGAINDADYKATVSFNG
ncbi:MAG: hypothetical protein K6T78_14055 [Alicyclobacillus sp.]|nr:hypothetical protein [Alicyclobacillus sp.]